MIGLPAATRIWLAAGITDMRCGFDTLAGKVQTALAGDPYSGHVFDFRGRRGDLVKVLWSDADGMCLFAKRLERGRFVAAGRRRQRGADGCAVINALGRHRLEKARAHVATAARGVVGSQCNSRGSALPTAAQCRP